MAFNLSLFLLIALVLGCTSSKTVNLQQHDFDQRSKQVIWFMIEGLHEEHLTLLKTNSNTLRERTSFEKALCFGKIWNFNLFQLRPRPFLGLLSQVTGSKNMTNSCDGLEKEPIWDIFHTLGYKSVILESAISVEDSFESSNRCQQKDFLSKSTLVRMYQEEGKAFHFQRDIMLSQGDILYDESCQKDVCFASFSNNAKAIWERIEESEQFFFVLRIGNYQKAMENKNITRAGEILTDINRLIEFFLTAEGNPLILVSSSGARNVEFPQRGQNWENFQEGAILYKRSSLMSPVWASGPGAENFCGIYEESDIYNRILWRPTRGLLERSLRQRFQKNPL